VRDAVRGTVDAVPDRQDGHNTQSEVSSGLPHVRLMRALRVHLWPHRSVVVPRRITRRTR
jgi:hypothetical protein